MPLKCIREQIGAAPAVGQGYGDSTASPPVTCKSGAAAGSGSARSRSSMTASVEVTCSGQITSKVPLNEVSVTPLRKVCEIGEACARTPCAQMVSDTSEINMAGAIFDRTLGERVTVPRGAPRCQQHGFCPQVSESRHRQQTVELRSHTSLRGASTPSASGRRSARTPPLEPLHL